MYSFELYCVGTFNFTVTFQSLQSVKRSDVTWNRFEWQLGENKAIKHPLP